MGLMHMRSFFGGFTRVFSEIAALNGMSPCGVHWYYRHTDINKKYVAAPVTVCQPIYNWWGFGFWCLRDSVAPR